MLSSPSKGIENQPHTVIEMDQRQPQLLPQSLPLLMCLILSALAATLASTSTSAHPEGFYLGVMLMFVGNLIIFAVFFFFSMFFRNDLFFTYYFLYPVRNRSRVYQLTISSVAINVIDNFQSLRDISFLVNFEDRADNGISMSI